MHKMKYHTLLTLLFVFTNHADNAYLKKKKPLAPEQVEGKQSNNKTEYNTTSTEKKEEVNEIISDSTALSNTVYDYEDGNSTNIIKKHIFPLIPVIKNGTKYQVFWFALKNLIYENYENIGKVVELAIMTFTVTAFAKIFRLCYWPRYNW